MRVKHLLVGVMVAALMLATAKAAGPPAQGSYAVNLGTAPYGAPTFVPGFVPMWLDPSDVTVNAFGLPRAVSPTSPFPVATTPASGSPGTSATSPSYVQEGVDPASPAVANPGTGARGWLGGILGANGTQADPATTGTTSNGSLVALTKQVRNLLSAPLPAQSTAWTDASYTATATASVPTGLVSVTSRIGLHVWNLNAAGGATACINYTSAAAANGAGCATGSVPVVAGAAYFEDQPGNVSPEAISIVCAGASCPLTIKVR